MPQNATTVAQRADKLLGIPAVKVAPPWVREVANEIAASSYPIDKGAELLGHLCANTNIPLTPAGAEKSVRAAELRAAAMAMGVAKPETPEGMLNGKKGEPPVGLSGDPILDARRIELRRMGRIHARAAR